MPFSDLLDSFPKASPVAGSIAELQKKFGDARASLLRIRADRVRLARTGWRPRPPSATKLIRSADWLVRGGSNDLGPIRPTVDFDLESRFVPTGRSYSEYLSALDRVRSEGGTARVFIRGIDLDEPRFSISGRPVSAAFFDLAVSVARDPGAIVVLPEIDGYLEARFWSEVARTLESGLGLDRDSIRFEVAIETLGGAVEAEEILFELKDSVVGIVYDVRRDRFDSLRLGSGAPELPSGDVAKDPWSGSEIASRAESLSALARRRGARLDLRPDGGPLREALSARPSEPLTLDGLHSLTSFAFRFLRGWFSGESTPEGKDWADFELSRALLWTAIRSGFLREENYGAWREEFGEGPFESSSAEEAAVRVLDPLVLTALFPDSAKPLAFSLLLERERASGGAAARTA